MINYIKKLLNYIYKDKCYFCSSSKENSIFCSKCFEKIDYLPFSNIDVFDSSEIFSCFYYKNIIQKLIRAVKYHNKKDLAYHQANLMFNFWINIKNKKENYVVIPVPMHNNRLQKRKYNHMDIVSKEFCKLSGYEFNNQLVKRIKDTAPQYKLSKKERENNLKNAFKCNYFNPLNKPILILDDITTTGSTLIEIIKELKKNGLHDITALTTAIPENNSFYIY